MNALVVAARIDMTEKKERTEMGARIEKRRRQLGLSCRELARRLKVAPTTISNWCYDIRPPEEKMEPLARELDKSREWLLTGRESPKAWNDVKLRAALRGARRALGMRGAELSDEEFDHLVALTYKRLLEMAPDDPEATAIDIMLDLLSVKNL